MKHNAPKLPPNSVLAHIDAYYQYNIVTGKILNKFYLDEIGSLSSDGYLLTAITTVDGKFYLRLHHIVWYMCYKKWPISQIDHRDGNRANNLIDNLKFSNPILQGRNRVVKSKGYKKYQGRYCAYINVNNKQIHLGMYSNEEDAKKARRQGEIKYWGTDGLYNAGEL